ncbi:hypothetical protein [Chryseobacterium oranimense]|uniref:hypothetical protein n=1 Tax=Chryseobacterium oranimense TaxID=421058 RepID=UPI000A50A82A|nr:hypothetical protein [Chryseobacterium oranimense]
MMRTAVPDQIKTERSCFSRTATDKKGNPGRTAPPGTQGEVKTKSQEYRGGYS